jgi:hypothetical protein
MGFWDSFTLFLSDKTLVVPLGQVVLFVFLVSLCFFFGRHKLGLLISYVFVFHWGFIFNREYFITILGDTSMSFFFYVLSGLMASILVLIGFFKENRP